MGYTWIEGCRRPRGVRDVRGGVSRPAIAKDRQDGSIRLRECLITARRVAFTRHGREEPQGPSRSVWRCNGTGKACAALARVLRSEMHGLNRFSRIDHLRTHKVKRVSVS